MAFYNVGLPQGFVKFGSLAERILKALVGRSLSHVELAEHLRRNYAEDYHFDHIGMTIHRLKTGKFIFERHQVSPLDAPVNKLCWRYSLIEPGKTMRKRPMTSAEKNRRARQRRNQKKLASSIFNLAATGYKIAAQQKAKEERPIHEQ